MIREQCFYYVSRIKLYLAFDQSIRQTNTLCLYMKCRTNYNENYILYLCKCKKKEKERIMVIMNNPKPPETSLNRIRMVKICAPFVVGALRACFLLRGDAILGTLDLCVEVGKETQERKRKWAGETREQFSNTLALFQETLGLRHALPGCSPSSKRWGQTSACSYKPKAIREEEC